ncbi:hypothetical protein BH10PSE1_BH10PSE1_31700 [soil metagenome]
MRSLDALAAGFILAGLISGSALGQVAASPPYAPYSRPNVTTGDIHRYQMDRLRAQADQNQALARSQALESQLTIQQLQSRRQAPLATPEPTRFLTLDEARQSRQATEARSATATRSMSQIDAWLDRRPQ